MYLIGTREHQIKVGLKKSEKRTEMNCLYETEEAKTHLFEGTIGTVESPTWSYR